VPEQRTQIYDDQARVRGELDLTGAMWTTLAPEGADPDGEYMQVAEVRHGDGADAETFFVLRSNRQTAPGDPMMVYTVPEWDAFTGGVRDGEFDELLE